MNNAQYKIHYYYYLHQGKLLLILYINRNTTFFQRKIKSLFLIKGAQVTNQNYTKGHLEWARSENLEPTKSVGIFSFPVKSINNLPMHLPINMTNISHIKTHHKIKCT